MRGKAGPRPGPKTKNTPASPGGGGQGAAEAPAALSTAWPTDTQARWPLSKIKPWPGNARTNPPEQISLLASILRRRGPDQPIVVDEKGFILKGHGRRMAAAEAAMAEFPVVQRLGLSEIEKREIRLEDNAVPLMSGWDLTLLRDDLTFLKAGNSDLSQLGFTDVNLVTFLAKPSVQDPEETPPEPKAAVSRLGDMWVMGEHRLLCADSTSAEAVAVALDGAKPVLMDTDPPYGVDYNANWRNERARTSVGMGNRAIGAGAVGKVENDTRHGWKAAYDLFTGNVAYVWCASLFSPEACLDLEASGFVRRAQIVWDKTRLIIGRGDYHWQHEPCWYMARKGKTGGWAGDRKQTTVWAIPHQASETGHSTQKPVECMRRPIQNNSKPGDVVYDPFTGSGTTIIACQLMNRKFRGLELSPAYVDVCVKRWQGYASGVATLAGDGRTFAEIAKVRGVKLEATK